MSASGLYGIEHSNRKPQQHWTKNCFNSSFPTALANYSCMNGNKTYRRASGNLRLGKSCKTSHLRMECGGRRTKKPLLLGFGCVTNGYIALIKDAALSTYWSIVRHLIENRISDKVNEDNILKYNTVNDRNIGILTMVMSLITLSITSDMELASDDGIIVTITNVVLDWRKPVYKVLMYIRRVHRELVWLDSHTLRAFE